MLSWMQKHKKYLVVTIWVSTIAFVGAGFVGWGAYDLNSNRATSVAKVGHRNISVQELQQKYDRLYQYYNNVFEGKLTQEKAEELGLENAALQAAIQENLLLNFADDIHSDPESDFHCLPPLPVPIQYSSTASSVLFFPLYHEMLLSK